MRRIIGSILFWGPLAVGAWLSGGDAEAQTRRMTSERQVWSTEPLKVDLQFGAGELEIVPAESPTLYRMELEYDERGFAPLVEFDEDSRHLRLGVRSPEDSRRTDIREGSDATIALTREVPLDLTMEIGAAEADIQLGGVSMRSLSFTTGASKTTVSFDAPNPITAERISIEAGAADLRVFGLGNARAERITFKGGVGGTVLDFSGEWNHSASATVEIGIGSVTLRLPRSQGIRINRSSFLTSFTAPGLERRDDAYFSANWQSAAHQLTIDLSAALGSIQIEWVD
jgi:hypothetical protein